VKTSPSPTKNLILSIIRIRSKIIEKNSSGKNIAKCYSIMKDLKVQIDAYGNRWTNEGWNEFAKRNMENLSFLIPENESGKNLKQQLYAL
jgi:hypothetical protein